MSKYIFVDELPHDEAMELAKSLRDKGHRARTTVAGGNKYKVWMA